MSTICLSSASERSLQHSYLTGDKEDCLKYGHKQNRSIKKVSKHLITLKGLNKRQTKQFPCFQVYPDSPEKGLLITDRSGVQNFAARPESAVARAPHLGRWPWEARLRFDP